MSKRLNLRPPGQMAPVCLITQAPSTRQVGCGEFKRPALNLNLNEAKHVPAKYCTTDQ